MFIKYFTLLLVTCLLGTLPPSLQAGKLCSHSTTTTNSEPSTTDEIRFETLLPRLAVLPSDNCSNNLFTPGTDVTLGWGSFFKNVVKKVGSTFLPKKVMDAAKWIGSNIDIRFSKTANRLAKYPDSPIARHMREAWGSGGQCSGFVNDRNCPACTLVARDFTSDSGTDLEHYLNNHLMPPKADPNPSPWRVATPRPCYRRY